MKKFVALLLLASSPAFAQWNKIPSADFTLRAPPREGSKAFKEDYRILLNYQRDRTPEQCELARRQKFPNYRSLFGDSRVLTAKEVLRAQVVVKKVVSLSLRVAVQPYDVDPRIEPCVEKPGGSTSYPSSHAAVALAASCVLAEIYPGKAALLETYGRELGELRAIIGVHHPSDVRAGQELAMDICQRLKTESDFRKDVADLRDN